MSAGYGRAGLRADVLAGLTVGVVALPLSMALAIASGVPPQHGLYTAIIAGTVVALLGGSRLQISGPTAAFVVLLVPVVIRHGLAGLLLAGFMAGVLQLAMGLTRMGRLIEFIPHPVTTGFTSGIAVVIATLQIKDVFGLQLIGTPDSFTERLTDLWHARLSASGWDALLAALTLVVLLGFPRLTRKLPSPLVALVVAAGAALLLERYVSGCHVASIGSRFHTVINGHDYAGIPPLPPLPVLPWHQGGAGGGAFTLDFATVRELLPWSLAIAMLGAIESLLSAVVADGMCGTRHNPNGELIALGIGNMLCPFFGGIPATGALARTATNIRAGAQSPLAAVIHALFVLATMIALAPFVAYIPMAALAALLMLVAYNMSEARHFVRLLRIAPRSDVVVLLTCFSLTVIFDMVIAVGVGVVLAALLFMQRMAESLDVRLDTAMSDKLSLPAGVKLYEIAGPLFFGAAQRAVTAFEPAKHTTAIVLKMDRVSMIDATGLVALETLLAKLHRLGYMVIFAGLTERVRDILDRADIAPERGKLSFAPDIDTALSLALMHDAGVSVKRSA